MRTVQTCLLLLLLTGFPLSAGLMNQPSNQVTGQKTAPTGIKHLIVVDFYVPEGAIQEKKGPLQGGGPLRRALRGDDDEDDPTAKAAKDSHLLAKVICEKLNDNDKLKAAGITAERDDVPDSLTPADTLVVDGAFVFVDEGGRLLQTGIGFGAGASKVEIESELLDYSKTPCEQVMKIGSHSNPRRGPGAILMMNPYVAAAKFVMSKNSSEKDIKKVGAGVAKEIANFLTGTTDSGQ